MEHVGKTMTKVLKKKEWNERYAETIANVLADKDVQAFLNEHKEHLPAEAIEKSYAKLYEFVQEKKKFQLNDPTMLAPGYEPKLFLNFHYIDVTYVPTAELLAQKEAAEIRSRVHSHNIPKDIRTALLEEMDLTKEREEVVNLLMDFIESYKADSKSFHQGIYLHGSFGVGKTYLLGALANRLAEYGISSTLVHFPTFAVEMKQAIGSDTVVDKLDRIKRAPILMLDDIGADSMSSWIRDDVLGVILQYRMQEQLPTFFTSNFDMQHLEKEHLCVTQRGENEPLKASRIMERIRYLAKEVELIGENRRHH